MDALKSGVASAASVLDQGVEDLQHAGARAGGALGGPAEMLVLGTTDAARSVVHGAVDGAVEITSGIALGGKLAVTGLIHSAQDGDPGRFATSLVRASDEAVSGVLQGVAVAADGVHDGFGAVLDGVAAGVEYAPVVGDVLGGFVGAAAAAVAAPALAYEGVYSMEIVKAGDAVLDKEALNSGPVKAALGDFKGYAIGIVNLQKALAANDQADVAKTLKTDYDFVKVRATFNALTPVFDEDTQKGVDRITRGILQDLVEAEAAAAPEDLYIDVTASSRLPTYSCSCAWYSMAATSRSAGISPASTSSFPYHRSAAGTKSCEQNEYTSA